MSFVNAFDIQIQTFGNQFRSYHSDHKMLIALSSNEISVWMVISVVLG